MARTRDDEGIAGYLQRQNDKENIVKYSTKIEMIEGKLSEEKADAEKREKRRRVSAPRSHVKRVKKKQENGGTKKKNRTRSGIKRFN